MGRGSAAKSRNPEGRGRRGAAAGAATAESEAGGEGSVVRDGFVLDFISGTKVLRETPREQVRQRIARALFHEYGVSVDDMEADFPAPVGGRRRRVDLAIFGSGEEHTPGNLQRVVVCRPEPKQNKRGAVKMRDYIFMAVAEKVGFDRRGNTLYKRSPEGEELTREVEEVVNGREGARTLRRKEKIVDDDLPEIARRYHAFRQEHPEPGA